MTIVLISLIKVLFDLNRRPSSEIGLEARGQPLRLRLLAVAAEREVSGSSFSGEEDTGNRRQEGAGRS